MSLAVFLLIVWSFLSEQAISMKKKLKNELDHYQLSLLTVSAIAIFSAISVIISWHFEISRTPISIFLLIFQIIAGVFYYPIVNKAIHHAERSTFSILGCIVLPIILVSDIILWYWVNEMKIVWVGIIAVILCYILWKKEISLKGIKYIMTANLIYMGMIIAFKYTTYHFMSTEMANFLITAPVALFFVPIVLIRKGIQGIKQTFRAKYLAIWGLYGIWWVLIAESYKTMIASMVMLFKQFFAMIFWLINARMLFHEKKLTKKILLAISMAIWIILMCLGV